MGFLFGFDVSEVGSEAGSLRRLLGLRNFLMLFWQVLKFSRVKYKSTCFFKLKERHLNPQLYEV